MDDPKVWAAMISGGLALIGTVYVAISNQLSRIEQDRVKALNEAELARFKAGTEEKLARLNADLQSQRDERLSQQEADRVISQFRDPLLHAAYDFQSRLFNILRGAFLDVYYSSGSEAEKEYAIENTVFLVAQYLGWTELVRQEVQFLDLGDEHQTRQLRSLQDSMYTHFQSDQHGSGFRLFAGEQRAVGELMIDRKTDLPRCIGYAAFLKQRPADIDHWLDSLREDIKRMSADLSPFKDRLSRLQHSLIDLLGFLDPDFVYFPAECRIKVHSSIHAAN